MERRRLGRTEHQSSLAVLGCAAFWRASPDEAARSFRSAIERGVNHIDIAPSYGVAEEVVGPLVGEVRDRLFVAGKTMLSDPAEVRRQFDDTRRLLGCDVLDLYQVHGVISLDELDGRVAAAEEILRLRDRGVVRYVGITGHDHETPGAQLAALERWDLDTVMFPVNPLLWANEPYREAAGELLAVCHDRDLGVHAIKAAARRPWSGADRWATTWYEPQRDPQRLAENIGFALSTPGVHVICTPGDTYLLEQTLDVTDDFTPLGRTDRETLIEHARSTQGGMADIFPRRHD